MTMAIFFQPAVSFVTASSSPFLPSGSAAVLLLLVMLSRVAVTGSLVISVLLSGGGCLVVGGLSVLGTDSVGGSGSVFGRSVS